MPAKWIVSTHGNWGQSSYEVAIVREDFEHGIISYGWPTPDRKVILTISNGGPLEKLFWDAINEMAVFLATELNRRECQPEGPVFIERNLLMNFEDFEDFEEWDDCTYVPPEPVRPTASELIEKDVRRAQTVLQEFISELTAKHLSAVAPTNSRRAYFNLQARHKNYSDFSTDHYGQTYFIPRQRGTVIEVSITKSEWLSKFSEAYNTCGVLNLEHIGIAGDWLIKSHWDDSYSDLIKLELVKVTL